MPPQENTVPQNKTNGLGAILAWPPIFLLLNGMALFIADSIEGDYDDGILVSFLAAPVFFILAISINHPRFAVRAGFLSRMYYLAFACVCVYLFTKGGLIFVNQI